MLTKLESLYVAVNIALVFAGCGLDGGQEWQKHRSADELTEIFDYWDAGGRQPGFKVSDYIARPSLGTKYLVNTNQVAVDNRPYHLRFGKRSELVPGGTMFICDEGAFLWLADGATNPVVFKHERKHYKFASTNELDIPTNAPAGP